MVRLKRVLTKNKLAVGLYQHLKRAVLFPIRNTKYRTILDNQLSVRDLFNFKKGMLLGKVQPYTMSDYERLSYTYDLARKAPEGAFVECGTWKGGNAAIMGDIARDSDRTTWYFDSFQGMREPTEKDIAFTRKGKIHAKDHSLGNTDMAEASVEDVEEIITILNLPKERNIIVKGWFEDTLPKKKEAIGNIALLRLDGDWYESTKTILNELYDQVVDGGYIIIDDYKGWQGCRRAVHDFLQERNIIPNFHFMGEFDRKKIPKVPSVYFVKGEKCEDQGLFNELEELALLS